MIAAALLALALAAPHPHAARDADDDDSMDVEINIPEINIPEINLPGIDIPAIRIPKVEIPDVSFLVAHASGRHHDKDKDDDGDDDDDNDCDDCGPEAPPPPPTVEKEDQNGVHIYRMQVHPAVPRIRVRTGHDDDDNDVSDATAQAKGHGSATLPVKGPVTFRISAQGGDIDVTSGDKPQVTVRIDGGSSTEVSLYSFGDRVEPRFRNRHSLRSGKLHVELPKGSRLEVASMSGDVTAQHLGEAHIRTLSGDVHLTQVGKLDVQSISGDVQVEDAGGPVRLHTVSGKATLSMRSPAPQVEFQSASGSLDFRGACGKDCHVSASTVSGDLRLALTSQSSFELSYSSHSGELRDGLDLAVRKSSRSRHNGASGSLEGTYGKGEGMIEADAFSGNLTLSKQ